MTCSLQMVAPSASATAAGRRWVLPPVAVELARDMPQQGMTLRADLKLTSASQHRLHAAIAAATV
ncbi:MAG TPA: hypothetical protein VJV87_01350, partial [Sphingomicrobium sp.]|nr:hypothetical protein [Sphingomicrobium sp.]